MIIRGSMQYSPCGRKRKTNAWKTTKAKKAVGQRKKTFAPSTETKKEYPSMKTSKYSTPVDCLSALTGVCYLTPTRLF